MKKRLFIFGVCLCVAGRLIAQDVHFMMQHEKTTMKSSVHGSNGIPLKLKTNLLYDALHVPNLSAELGLGKNMSIGLDYWYTWFDSNPTHNYWRSYGGGIGIRRYFGRQSYRQSLTGHHIGIVSQMGMYDVEYGKRGNMSDFSYTLGTEYGYVFPLSSRFSLDLSVAFGYFGGRYKVYDPIDTHYVWKKNHNRNYFGPIKADITLAYQISKCRKGDKR